MLEKYVVRLLVLGILVAAVMRPGVFISALGAVGQIIQGGYSVARGKTG